MKLSVKRSFMSLQDCLAFLREEFPSLSVPLQTSEVQANGSSLLKPRLVPRYLFRGEPKDSTVHETAIASWYRLGSQRGLDDVDRKQIRQITENLVRWFSNPASNFDLREHDAVGLVQHLGLPTHYMDFSSDLAVAGAFAVGDRAVKDTGRGSICALAVAQAQDLGVIAEFCNHRWCDRARRQIAFGYKPTAFKDLRSTEADNIASWFEFEIQPEDIEHFRSEYKALIDAGTDPVAGLLRLEINSYVADTGKLRRGVAEWITRRIPMVPAVGRIQSWHSGPDADLPDLIDWIPPCTLPEWDEEREREVSHRFWSESFSDTLAQDYLVRSRMEDDLFVAAATYHPHVDKLYVAKCAKP